MNIEIRSGPPPAAETHEGKPREFWRQIYTKAAELRPEQWFEFECTKSVRNNIRRHRQALASRAPNAELYFSGPRRVVITHRKRAASGTEEASRKELPAPAPKPPPATTPVARPIDQVEPRANSPKAAKIAPSDPSRWTHERVRESSGNAATIAASIRDPLPGTIPSTFREPVS